MIKRILAVLVISWLAGCSSPQTIDAKMFKKLFVESRNDSAVSWWYYGEDGASYYLSQKDPLKETKFKVSKNGVEFRNVVPHQKSKSGAPVNLKAENVVFNKNAL